MIRCMHPYHTSYDTSYQYESVSSTFKNGTYPTCALRFFGTWYEYFNCRTALITKQDHYSNNGGVSKSFDLCCITRCQESFGLNQSKLGSFPIVSTQRRILPVSELSTRYRLSHLSAKQGYCDTCFGLVFLTGLCPVKDLVFSATFLLLSAVAAVASRKYSINDARAPGVVALLTLQITRVASVVQTAPKSAVTVEQRIVLEWFVSIFSFFCNLKMHRDLSTSHPQLSARQGYLDVCFGPVFVTGLLIAEDLVFATTFLSLSAATALASRKYLVNDARIPGLVALLTLLITRVVSIVQAIPYSAATVDQRIVSECFVCVFSFSYSFWIHCDLSTSYRHSQLSATQGYWDYCFGFVVLTGWLAKDLAFTSTFLSLSAVAALASWNSSVDARLSGVVALLTLPITRVVSIVKATPYSAATFVLECGVCMSSFYHTCWTRRRELQ